MRADLPSGKVPTTRVRLRISRFRRSIALLVRTRRQCSRGKAVYARVSGAFADDPGGLTEPHPLELVRDRERLCLGGLARLHGVDRLEHGRDRGAPGLRHAGGHIAVEVHGAAPAGGLRERLRDRADHAGRLVADGHP